MLDLHRIILDYAQFRARAIGYRYSGKETWDGIKAGCLRGAVTWTREGKLTDRQFPILLIHYESESRDPSVVAQE